MTGKMPLSARRQSQPRLPALVSALLLDAIAADPASAWQELPHAGAEPGRSPLFALGPPSRPVPPAMRLLPLGEPIPFGAEEVFVQGYVDWAGPDDLAGWVWQVGRPDQPVKVDIFADGQRLATLTADRPRPDLRQAGIGRGRHGFHWRPRSKRHGALLAAHAVTARVNGSTLALPMATLLAPQAPARPQATLHRSGFHRASLIWSKGDISGWIIDTRSDRPVPITIDVDGNMIWSGAARRQVVIDAAAGPRSAGFRVAVPAPSQPAGHRTVSVRLDDGTHVPGSPLRVDQGEQFIGYVEAIAVAAGQTVIRGWCIDTAHPSARVPLRVRAGAETLAAQVQYAARADLSATGYDAPYAAFTATLTQMPRSRLNDLVVGPALASAALPRSSGFAVQCQAPDRPRGTGRTDPVLTLPTDEIDGAIDEITDRHIRGWVRNVSNPHAQIVLDCTIDGALHATMVPCHVRPDPDGWSGNQGCQEFQFELTPPVLRQYPGEIRIEPRTGRGGIRHLQAARPQALPQANIIPPRTPNLMQRWALKPSPAQPRPASRSAPSLSIVVINHNGAPLLESMLRSFARWNSLRGCELLIVDHGSTDESQAVVAAWRAALAKTRTALRWLPRDGNDSFSASSNYGSMQARGEIVAFVNNDITFVQDVFPQLLHYFADPRISCLGIRLLDDAPVSRADGQAAIQHLGVHFQPGCGSAFVDPFESRFGPIWSGAIDGPTEVPAVTGAFMACRRAEFLQLGGFDERFFYGYEDVDLCLKYQAAGRQVVAANELQALHRRGFSRARMDRQYDRARARNGEVLNGTWALWLRRQMAAQRFERPAFWSATPLRIAFAVSEASETTLAGDCFTALELAEALTARFGCECGFVERSANTQYDLSGFDVLIAMLDDYDPRQIRAAPPHLLKVAWLRNWFERFAAGEAATEFDIVWAASQDSCDTLAKQLSKPVHLMPLAGNSQRFKGGRPDPAFASDYCFTGSYWGLHRDIVQLLDPAALPFRFALFGQGWEAVPSLAPYSRGPVPYPRMADVYASTRLVIDDANHVTRDTGAVNSRVFDALLAGALVITSGVRGAQSLFQSMLPSFATPQELEDLLWHYLGNEAARRAKVAELQRFVLKHHTYRIRANQAWRCLRQVARSQLRFAIKIGAPNRQVQHEWGDRHFALALKRALDAMGHTARIDCLDAWYAPQTAGDDVVLVIRGLSEYRPRAGQINLMWNISHPHTVSIAEYNRYDHVFVASALWATRLQSMLQTPVTPLLQCTDPALFHPQPQASADPGPVLFVGNSRNQFRPVVAAALAAGLKPAVYGTGWEGFLPGSAIKGQHIENSTLASHYRSASVLLNDHWPDMRDAGFISNRIFDGLACGARLVSDDVPGLSDLFGTAVRTWHDPPSLLHAIASFAAEDETARQARLAMAQHVALHHSFANRVAALLQVVDRLMRERTAAPVELAAAVR